MSIQAGRLYYAVFCDADRVNPFAQIASLYRSSHRPKPVAVPIKEQAECLPYAPFKFFIAKLFAYASMSELGSNVTPSIIVQGLLSAPPWV